MEKNQASFPVYYFASDACTSHNRTNLEEDPLHSLSPYLLMIVFLCLFAEYLFHNIQYIVITVSHDGEKVVISKKTI